MKDLINLGLAFEPTKMSTFDYKHLTNENVIKLLNAKKQYALIYEDEISIHKDFDNVIRNIKTKLAPYEFTKVIILDLFS
tara:strand:+ start:2721 stop:2960 length:240 start_codon:yes stop_codon:yes gene_type:complete